MLQKVDLGYQDGIRKPNFSAKGERLNRRQTIKTQMQVFFYVWMKYYLFLFCVVNEPQIKRENKEIRG